MFRRGTYSLKQEALAVPLIHAESNRIFFAAALVDARIHDFESGEDNEAVNKMVHLQVGPGGHLKTVDCPARLELITGYYLIMGQQVEQFTAKREADVYGAVVERFDRPLQVVTALKGRSHLHRGTEDERERERERERMRAEIAREEPTESP